MNWGVDLQLLVFGMGGVFVALIILALVIAFANLVFGAIGKRKVLKGGQEVVDEGERYAGIQPEVVAAITAAIAIASGGVPFVVRSVTPLRGPAVEGIPGINVPAWGHQDRMRKTPR
jgi:Na+-transporting methylmalonyl-CoA/oxaloacetate decarboxylase gamma subunit